MARRKFGCQVIGRFRMGDRNCTVLSPLRRNEYMVKGRTVQIRGHRAKASMGRDDLDFFWKMVKSVPEEFRDRSFWFPDARTSYGEAYNVDCPFDIWTKGEIAFWEDDEFYSEEVLIRFSRPPSQRPRRHLPHRCGH